MAKKITQKQLKHDEFVDAAFDFGHWLEEHWVRVVASVGVVIALVVTIVLWNAWSRQREERAKEVLAQGVDRYEDAQAGGFADRETLDAAFETFDGLAGRGSGSGRVARFYRGATLFRLNRLDEAKADLERVVSDAGAADTLGATAQMLLARVETAAGRAEEAAVLLERLAGESASAIPPDQVLLELGRLYRQTGRLEDARDRWQRVVDEYPESAAAAEARTLLQQNPVG
jgi:predicted negative regulator of RcsB-dependent stress response